VNWLLGRVFEIPIKSSYTGFIQVLYNIVQNLYRICSDSQIELKFFLHYIKEMHGNYLNLYSIFKLVIFVWKLYGYCTEYIKIMKIK